MSINPNTKVQLKIVLLGQHDVGKTSLVERYLHKKFKPSVTATVGAAFGAKKVEINGESIVLGIWDTAGAERYESLSRIYYRSARAALVCYDITAESSFNKAKFWITEIKNNEPDCCIYIVGTKTDMLQEGSVRATSLSTVKGYAESVHAQIFETSAKSGAGVDDLFSAIAQDYFNSVIKKPSFVNGVDIGKSGSTPSFCCLLN